LLLIGASLAGLPWIVRIPPAHRLLAACANYILAPGSIEFGAVDTAWFRPSVIHDVTLRDAEGDAVLVAPTFRFSWGLWQILMNRPKTAHVDLAGAQLDIERRSDGKIDLQETLKPVTPEHPKIQLLIHIEEGQLRLRDPLLAEPLLADDVKVDLDMSRGYEPISGRISMVPADPAFQSGRLELEGSYSRANVDRLGRHDVKAAVKLAEWPLTLANPDLGIKCRGVFSGQLDADLQSDRWLSRAESKIRRFELTAPRLADAIRLDTVSAEWNVSAGEKSWTVHRLALESSLLTLAAGGGVPAVPERAAWMEAKIDLATLAQWFPAVGRRRDGFAIERATAQVRADLKAGGDGMSQTCDVRGTVSSRAGLPAGRVLAVSEPAVAEDKSEVKDALVLDAHATYDPRSNRLDLSRLRCALPYVRIDGAGVVRDLTGASQLDLAGTLNPDWAALSALLADRVEPKARIAGQPRPWRVSTSLAKRRWEDALASLRGNLGIQVDELDVFGMRLGRSSLAARIEDGKIEVDPIDTTLNQGKLHIEPEVARDDNGHRYLRLGKASRLEGAVINDEVSHRVLAYAAPVLDGATRVQGRISAGLSEASFPIAAPSGTGARVAGELILDDVRFMPGKLAEQLLAVIGKEDDAILTLRDKVSVRIEKRKVHQKGLLISVAELASIALDGSVDFDKNLDLVANLSMSRTAPIAGVLPPLVRDAHFDIPIRGTLGKPSIDTSGFKERIANLGMNIVGNSVEAGLDGLQRALRGKALKGLGEFLLRGPRAMSPPPGADDDSNSDRPKQPRGVPKEPQPEQGEGTQKDDTDRFE
jgi:hypothetical protein